MALLLIQLLLVQDVDPLLVDVTDLDMLVPFKPAHVVRDDSLVAPL